MLSAACSRTAPPPPPATVPGRLRRLDVGGWFTASYDDAPSIRQQISRFKKNHGGDFRTYRAETGELVVVRTK